jgi:restriction system protein
MSLLENVFELVSRLPWWVSVVCAIGSCVALREVKEPPPLRTAATFGQIILPLLFLAGAGISLIRRRSRSRKARQ